MNKVNHVEVFIDKRTVGTIAKRTCKQRVE